MKKIWLWGFSAIFSLIIIGWAAAQTTTEVPGTTLAAIRLREGPGTEYNTLATLSFGTPLNIEARNFIGNWLLIRTEAEQRGWVASRFVSWSPDIELAQFVISGEVFGEPTIQTTLEAPQAAGTPQAVALNGTPGRTLARINLRSGPDTTAPILERLEFRTRVVIEARNAIGNWLLITTEDGALRGWVASRFVSWPEAIDLATFPISAEGVETIALPAGTPAAAVSADATQAVVPAGTTPGRILVNKLNVRRGAGTAFEALGQLERNTPIAIAGRNFIGDWLLIQTLDGSVRGWVASRFVSWSDEVLLASFPVTGEEIPAP